MSVVMLFAACAAISDDPEVLLRQAISGVVAEDDFRFEGITRVQMSGVQLEPGFRFIGEVREHNDIVIEPFESETDRNRSVTRQQSKSNVLHYARVNKRWTINEGGSDKQLSPLYTINPLIHIEYLNRARKDLVVRERGSKDGLVMVQATINDEQLAREFREQIKKEHEATIQSALEELRSGNSSDLAAKIATYAEQRDEQLKQMLETLAIKVDYRLKMDRRSRNLRELDVQMGLQYQVGGENREETIHTKYRFER